jgi:hypothetical protein
MFYWASGTFDMQSGLLAGGAAAATAWGLVDAFRPRQGALHYAAGEWVLAQGEHESQGTLQVAMDLQHYLLVRFIPLEYGLHASQQQQQQQQSTKPQWLHLERRPSQRPGLQREQTPGQDWRALRRALYATATTAMPTALAAPADRT